MVYNTNFPFKCDLNFILSFYSWTNFCDTTNHLLLVPTQFEFGTRAKSSHISVYMIEYPNPLRFKYFFNSLVLGLLAYFPFSEFT